MKAILTTFLVFLIMSIIFSCSKEKPRSLDASLLGKWEYIQSIGGFTGKDTLRPPLNTTIILSLNSSQAYSISSNGQVTKQGTYKVINIQNFMTGSNQYGIQFDDFSSNSGLLIDFNEPILSLSDNHYEPYGHLYRRVQ